MRIHTLSLIVFFSLLVSSGCAQTANNSARYDQNSWKQIIPDNCRVFFDGCNRCRREPGQDIAACTRMACAEYQKPRCLEPSSQAESAVEEAMPERPRSTDYVCENQARYRLFRQQPSESEKSQALGIDEVLLKDLGDNSEYRLNRTRSASGAQYRNTDVVFWVQGKKAMLTMGNAPALRCEAIGQSAKY